MIKIEPHTIWNLDDPEDHVRATKSAVIGQQNDRFRNVYGADFTVPGRIVQTASVAALPLETQVQVMVQVQTFKDFTEDNDPYGLHDFGSIIVDDEGTKLTLFWKIDLYDTEYVHAPERPEEPRVTRRVLTIMQPHEY